MKVAGIARRAHRGCLDVAHCMPLCRVRRAGRGTGGSIVRCIDSEQSRRSGIEVDVSFVESRCRVGYPGGNLGSLSVMGRAGMSTANGIAVQMVLVVAKTVHEG